MTDKFTPEKRRKIMQHIKGKNTTIELILRKALYHKGYHYRTNSKKLPGHPDIVFNKYKLVIFCDGEFFHGKDKEKLLEKLKNADNSEFWISKIERNCKRDIEVNEKLKELGYTVLRFWETDIRKHTDECVQKIEEEIQNFKNKTN